MKFIAQLLLLADIDDEALDVADDTVFIPVRHAAAFEHPADGSVRHHKSILGLEGFVCETGA